LEYFQKQINVDYYLNGSARKIDETRKIQTFNATLSLCEYYPLSLHEQVSPIVDLMALNNSHFKKLKEFITLQLPSGFPVKIEIPLYRVITAKVTFGNIHAIDMHVDHVTTIKKSNNSVNSLLDQAAAAVNDSVDNENACLLPTEDADNIVKKSISSSLGLTCIVDEKVFKIPSSYRCTNQYLTFDTANLFDSNTSNNRSPNFLGPQRGAGAASIHNDHRRANFYGQGVDDDDILLQLAIQQSMAMSGKSNSNATEDLDEQQLTALEMLGHRSDGLLQSRDTTGGTQSLQEYHQRQNNALINQVDEDLILQRVLAESLLITDASGTVIDRTETSEIQQQNNIRNNVVLTGDEDEALKRILELSRREEEERMRAIQQEDEELRKILELSLIEK
jgi:hypothetical protein